MTAPDAYKRPSILAPFPSKKDIEVGKARAATIERTNKIASLNRSIEEYSITETRYKEAIKKIDVDIAYWTNIARTSTVGAAILNAESKLAELKPKRINFVKELQGTVIRLNAAKTERNKIINGKDKRDKKDKKDKTDKKDGSKVDGTSSPDTDKGVLQWKYNPPMVQAAYLKVDGLQRQDGFIPVNDAGVWTDARSDAWKNNKGASKGVIQMSRNYPYNFTGVGLNTSKDQTIYGFKFLYNPTSVSMSWGVSTEIDVAQLMAGNLKAKPQTDAALNSSVTFSIILNRMLDMNSITENGGIKGTNPYSRSLSTADLQGIYNKGTMHDLEYLFRAVNGKGVDYTSGLLEQKTADVGWLNSFPVELHLGSGLRYLVRVTQLNVEHIRFNERMVPTFSTVDIVCKRLLDTTEFSQEDIRAGGMGGGIAQVR